MRQSLLVLAATSACVWASQAEAGQLRVTFTNLQPVGGLHFSPVVFVSHDGSYDFFNAGAPASSSVQQLAEDGAADPRIASALASGRAFEAVRAPGGPIAPGESRTVILNADPANGRASHLSFASMAVPSNDAFIGNDDPSLIPLFDPFGRLIERTGTNALVLTGNDIWDAGTEINDEIPENTAFLGQTVPNTGADENGVIRSHPGFQGSVRLGGPTGNILSAFPGTDFTVPGTAIASITVTDVPEPGTLTLLSLGAVGLAGWGWRRHKTRRYRAVV